MDSQGRSRSWIQQIWTFLKWSWEWDALGVEEAICYLFSIRRPTIYAAEGPVGELAREALDHAYWPTPLLGSAMQVLLAFTVRDWAFWPAYHRTNLRLDDGGTVALDWFRWKAGAAELPGTAPVLLVAHSITGHSRLGCVLSLCDAAFREGWRPVALNYRGCGGTALTSPRTYSAAETGDLHAAAAHVQWLFPDAPLLLAGYSIGAMILTKYLSDLETGAHHLSVRPVAAVAASSPFDIGAAWHRLSAASWLSEEFWIQLPPVLRWQHYMWMHRRQLRRVKGFQADAIWRCRNMLDVDAALTCKVFGYKTVEQYYRAAESFQYIPSIRTPCLFAVAADDPFVRKLPIQECRNNPNIILAVTVSGSHCAHLQGVWPLGRSYLDDTAVRFLKAALGGKDVDS